MAFVPTAALGTLNSVGVDFERAYEEYVRSRQAAIEQQYVRSRQAAIEQQYRETQYVLSRASADTPIGQFLDLKPPPPTVSSSHKWNKRLLLCHP